MNTATINQKPEVSSQESVAKPTEPPRIKITTLDFYHAEPRVYLHSATAFHLAWKKAVEHRAPLKLRAELRWWMRYYAQITVREARKAVRPTFTQTLAQITAGN